MSPWRGVVLDDRSAAMMDEVTRLCPGITIDPTQGSYSGSVGASAGTHDGGGAIDLVTDNWDAVVAAMRRVGWAAWHRTPAQSNWPHHIHGIAVGCPDLSTGARDQVEDYLAGRNGLASNAPDDGPRDWVGTTWETYLEESMNPVQAEDLAECRRMLAVLLGATPPGTPAEQPIPAQTETVHLVEQVAELRRMLAVVLGAQDPVPPEQSIREQVS